MAARKRAQDRIFNRRRRLILDKGFDLARNQLQTSLGQCLVRGNVKEAERLAARCGRIDRTGAIEQHHQEAGLRLFVIERDRATRQPSRVCERRPPEPGQDAAERQLSAEEAREERRPRYMRSLTRGRPPQPQFSTMALFRAETKRTRNLWEKVDPSAVQFRAAISPAPPLSAAETASLREAWTQQQARLDFCRTLPSELRRKSAPARRFLSPHATSLHPPAEEEEKDEEEEEEEETGEEEEAQDSFISRLAGARRAVTAPPQRRVGRVDAPVVRGREVIELRSICRDVESVSILQQVLCAGRKRDSCSK